MVVLFVVLTIILFVSIDYFIQRKKKIGLESQPHPGTVSLSRVLSLLPRGVFIQPSFTWSKLLDSGNLALGIQPILMGLIGEPDEIELLHNGEEVGKNQSLMKIHKGDKVLTVSSPVKGTITAINQQILDDPTFENLSQNWVYSIRPENVSQEVSSWMVAEKAQTWLNEKFNSIRNFFQESAPQTAMGVTMADGGDLPFGVLSQFDEDVWKKFENEVIGSKK
ncbi:MAG: hypothetical protein EH225_00550 [Calditrichaeota bacterium]|nr:hypothetical protein [Calditrichota bacterium]RQW08171.1 MAG: hypothetical protein EH225_00550 [Calditrichota bacterium]